MSAGFPRLGRYVPQARLGQSRATETFRARTDQPVPGTSAQDFTLKVLRPLPDEPDLPARFVAAARVLQWMSSPGTPAVVEIVDGPTPFVALAFQQGVDLAQLRAQAAPPGVALDARVVGLLGRKLAERLALVYGQADGPRMHGGLSPGNVLVLPSGDILLLDCGIAEALRSPSAWPSESWRWASPEQLRGGPADQASDFFALGSLLYFLCYGKSPFVAGTCEELEACIAQGPPAFEGVHPAIAGSIARMLAYAPAARPKSATEIVRQLSVALLSANANVGAPAPIRPSPQPANRTGVFAGETVSAEAFEPDTGVDASSADEASSSEAAAEAFAPGPADLPVLPDRSGAIDAGDPEVGAVYDDEDDDELEVDAQGRLRRRRRRSIRLLGWTKSEFARKVFRYAWAPLAVLLLAGAVEGYFFARSWRAARAQSRAQEAEQAAEQARLDAIKPKLHKAPAIPAGHLVLDISPDGATVWLDGQEAGTAPSTLLTHPGAHRLVVTLPGYRMLRDVIDTSHGALFKRKMAPAVFPLSGSVGLNVGCNTEGKYPVFVDGKETGALCPIAGIRLDPGKHLIGIFVIPDNRVWTLDRLIEAGHPQSVRFRY